MNAMPILPKQIPCVCIMYYYMANKDDSDSDSDSDIYASVQGFKHSGKDPTYPTVFEI